MYRQKSSEDAASVPDNRNESEASKSVTSLRRPSNRENSGSVNSESSKKENIKEKLSSLGNINLAILTKHLYSKEDLKEDDVPWSWDSLFTEVASELRSHWEKTEARNPSS